MNSALPIVYGIANVLLMAWAGFGGLETLPAFFRSPLVCTFLYLLFWLLAIYVVLARTSAETRKSVRYAIFAPWGFVLFLVVPQFLHDPRGATIICVWAALVWFMYIPGERLVSWLQSNEQDT
jgi:FtsH-binding integral membrane protein